MKLQITRELDLYGKSQNGSLGQRVQGLRFSRKDLMFSRLINCLFYDQVFVPAGPQSARGHYGRAMP